jgi:hypothetical protein
MKHKSVYTAKNFKIIVIIAILSIAAMTGCDEHLTAETSAEEASTETITGDSLVIQSYPVVDTGQTRFFQTLSEIEKPESGSPFYGQDASYSGLTPSYTDNGNGTVTDLNTGLM